MRRRWTSFATRCNTDATGSFFMSAPSYQHVLKRIRAEYLEMPGMRLKLEQVQRLCGIEQSICKMALDSLVEANFLCTRSDGSYARP